MVKEKMLEGESLIEALARIAGEGRIEFRGGKAPTWTDEQKRLLASLLGDTLIDRLGMGSEEIDQLLRKQLQQKLHSESASGLSGAVFETLGPTTTSLFSGIGARAGSAQPFSASGGSAGSSCTSTREIIFYGGTHPDATVWVDGQEIKLAPGRLVPLSFSRCSDGDFAIPILAQSPDKVREKTLFRDSLLRPRHLAHRRRAGATGQPGELKPLICRK